MFLKVCHVLLVMPKITVNKRSMGLNIDRREIKYAFSWSVFEKKCKQHTNLQFHRACWDKEKLVFLNFFLTFLKILKELGITGDLQV